MEDADPELNRVEAAELTVAVRMTEGAREDAQSAEDVHGALEAGQEHHPRAGQPCIDPQTQCLSPVLSPLSQFCLTVKPHEKDRRMQV